jgi:hypothetical protein
MNITQLFSCCNRKKMSYEEIQTRRIQILPFAWRTKYNNKITAEDLNNSAKTYCELSKKISQQR